MAATPEPFDRAPQRRTLDGGRLLAGVGALALLVSLFLAWYGPPGDLEDFARDAGERDTGISGWTSFELIDILLAVLSLATIAWALEAVMRRSDRELMPSRLGTLAGPVALTLVLVSLVSDPPSVALIDPELRAGAWIALAGAAVMTIGAFLAIARISVVVAARERAGSPPGGRTARPETETRPLTGEPPRQPPGL